MNFDQLRAKYKGYTDDEILGALQVTQYPGYSAEEIKAATGYKPPKRSIMGAVNDTVIELANAAAGGVKAGADFVSPGNRVSSFIDENIIKPGEASQSDAVKAEKARLQQELQGAQGIGDEVGAALGYVARNLVLATAQAFGSFALPAGAVRGTSIMGKGLLKLTDAGAARAGLAGGAAAGAALSGGDAAGTAYELAKRAGATEEQAVEAARQASVIPAAIGGAGGVIGAERLVAGAKGFGGGAVSRALKTGGVEALQEGVEEGVTQYEGQRAAMPYDPTIDPTKGVAGAATLGAALGGITGAGILLLTKQERADRAMDDLARAPDVDSAVDAFNRATDVPIVGLTAEQENAAMGAMERQADADLKGLRQFGKGGTPVPNAPVSGVSGAAPDLTATVTDSPLADRILSLREELADPNTREKVRGTMGMGALQNALYYLDRADGAKDIPDATRERMLGVAEEIVSRSILRPIRKPGQIAPSEFSAPGQIGMTPDTAPRLTAGSTPTGTVKVDSAGNAMPETQADRTSLRQRAEAMKRRGMEGQTARGGEPGAGVMVGEGTLTTPQRKTPAPPAPQPTLLLTSDGMPYGTRSAAYVRAKKEGGEVVDVPGGWAVEVAAAPAEPGADDLKRMGFNPAGPGPGEWVMKVSNLGEVIAKVVSENPLRVEISADYLGKRLGTRVAEGEPAIAEAIKTARDGINAGRQKMAAEGVPNLNQQWRDAVARGDAAEARRINDQIVAAKAAAKTAPEVPNAPVQPPREDAQTPRPAAPTAEATQAAGGDAATKASVPGARAGGADAQADGVKAPWQVTREAYFSDPARVRRDVTGGAANGQWRISYDYDRPGGAGPYKGSATVATKMAAGDKFAAPFGTATVRTVSRAKPGDKTDGGDLYEQGKAFHRKAVADAVAAGQDVPAEVLADYPDLKNPAPATPESVAQPEGERNGVRQEEGRGRQEVAPTQEAGMAPAESPAPETVKQLTDSPTLRERAKGMGKKKPAEVGPAMRAAMESVGLDPDAEPNKAKKLRKEAERMQAEARKMLEGIPPGQPVMSTRDRNLRERAMDKTRKAAELAAEADRLDAEASPATPEADMEAEPAPEPATPESATKPPRPEALIAARKRLSVLESLRKCIG